MEQPREPRFYPNEAILPIKKTEQIVEEKEIIIRNGKMEITINEKAISISAPNISLTVMSDEKSTSITTATKNGICANCTDLHSNDENKPVTISATLDGKTISRSEISR